MGSKKGLFKQISNAVVRFDEVRVVELAQQSLEEGHDPLKTLMDGLSAGMLIVGDLYVKGEYFIPEMLLCADAFQMGLDVLQPHIPEDIDSRKAQVVIGTVKGDVHDIGKNIVKMMLEVSGFTVHDLGKDVPLEKFVEEQNRTGSEIVALSAMMTTSIMAIEKAIKMLRECTPNVAIMVGGASINKEIAKNLGADGYADTAIEAVPEAARILDIHREEKS